eukprot:m.10155 g.10155  ORF g.10155 m.10155 type:complete len:389 (+) comp4209_c0_seq1:122-1288(+)
MNNNTMATNDKYELLEMIRKRKSVVVSEIEILKKQIQDVEKELEELDELDAEECEATDSKEKILRKIKWNFNAKPKKGIIELIESGLSDGSAKNVAEWLLNTEGLKKGAIGEYLGENEPFFLDVLKEFSKLHNFTDLSFDAALRQYLASFRLPGEAQKIDRMMVSYAERYCECNPAVFSHQDTCYVLAFSTIMLNTALHNPSVKQKQTLESFINMNRGIDQGQDLPQELLTDLFHSIESSPFKFPDDEETMTFFNPEREGWLHKEGGRVANWRKRWFTLANNCLYYFEDKDDTKPKGTIPLENLFVRELASFKKPNCFELLCEDSGEGVKGAKTNRKGQIVQGRHDSYKLQATDRAEMEGWIKCIRAAMQRDPVFEMFQAHRRFARKE